jgi:prepilin-type N-terminal cleavage/methylation domain-containing protein
MKKRKFGFTLIELLIVVAIIAILAAIAVPNFLEAQVRSKVSRCRSDMRTFATALESYRTDENGYPPYGAQDPNIDFTPGGGIEPQFLEPHWLTTPIAYISSASSMQDPFRSQSPPGNWTYPEIHFKLYNYVNWDDPRYKNELSTPAIRARFGEWRLVGSGPDRWRFSSSFSGPDYIPWCYSVYDPTNGTVSIGDVARTQKEPDPKWLNPW